MAERKAKVSARNLSKTNLRKGAILTMPKYESLRDELDLKNIIEFPVTGMKSVAKSHSAEYYTQFVYSLDMESNAAPHPERHA